MNDYVLHNHLVVRIGICFAVLSILFEHFEVVFNHNVTAILYLWGHVYIFYLFIILLFSVMSSRSASVLPVLKSFT